MTVYNISKVEKGNILIQDGFHAPFVVLDVENHMDGYFEIVSRQEITPRGMFGKVSNRAIRSTSLEKYGLVSKVFMDDQYVKWASDERCGAFINKQLEAPKKPSNSQLDVVKAVFFRQNRFLNPNITVEEVENLWVNHYFPLYCQVAFELDVHIDETGLLGPLNCDPIALMPSKRFVETRYNPRSYVVPTPSAADVLLEELLKSGLPEEPPAPVPPAVDEPPPVVEESPPAPPPILQLVRNEGDK